MISGIIGGIIAVLICTYVIRKIRNQSQPGDLSHGKFIVGLAWVCLAFVAFAFSMFFIDANVWEDKTEFYSAIGLIVGFGTGAGYLFLEVYKVKGSYDEDGIEFYTPWTGYKNEKWSDLRSVKFSSSAGWYVLSFKSGSKIRLSSFLIGLGDVLQLLEEKEIDF